MTYSKLRVRMRVYDRWWPLERRGIVEKITGRRVWVRWLDDTVWRYDRDHVEFLERS